MADSDHLKILKKGVKAWNEWRKENPDIKPDLADANLGGAHLKYGDLWPASLPASAFRDPILETADLRGLNLENATLDSTFLGHIDLRGASFRGAQGRNADLRESDLREVDFSFAAFEDSDFSETDLRDAIFSQYSYFYGTSFMSANLAGVQLPEAHLEEANLAEVQLDGANLERAKLPGANLFKARLARANLNDSDLSATDLTQATLRDAQVRGADLSRAILVETVLQGADLTGATIYGISAWNVNVQGAIQSSLVITARDRDESTVTVDNLEVGQFIYLLLNNEKIRDVIDTVTQRGVLILGRFGDGGLVLLQAIAAWLRKPENGAYLPLLFDFPRPKSKTYTETVRTLAGLARFVIVDLSGPSVPQEITATVDLHEIPFVPILEQKRQDWSMFRDFLVKERVLKPIRFADQDHLLELLAEEVIAPAENMIEERQKRLDSIFGRA